MLARIGDSETRIFRVAYAFDESDIFQFTQVGHDIILLERSQDAEACIVVGCRSCRFRRTDTGEHLTDPPSSELAVECLNRQQDDFDRGALVRGELARGRCRA